MMRILAALFAGQLALMLALDCGLPLWRSWPMGDAADFAVTTALFVLTSFAVLAKMRTP